MGHSDRCQQDVSEARLAYYMYALDAWSPHVADARTHTGSELEGFFDVLDAMTAEAEATVVERDELMIELGYLAAGLKQEEKIEEHKLDSEGYMIHKDKRAIIGIKRITNESCRCSMRR
jgi:hypothetical protein